MEPDASQGSFLQEKATPISRHDATCHDMSPTCRWICRDFAQYTKTMIAAKRLLKEWKATPNKQRSTVRTDDETVPGATFVQPGVPKVNDTKVCFGY